MKLMLMLMLMRRSLQSLVVALAVLAAAPTSYAQSERDLAVRQELIQRAQDARTANDHVAALAQSKKAAAIKMTPSLRFFIAQEHVALGQIGEAFSSAKLCVVEAERDTTVRNRADLITSCKDIEKALAPRVGRIVLKPPQPQPEGLRVKVAGEDVSTALLNTPYIVTPGKVSVEASAPHFGVSKAEVEIAEGASVDHEITLAPEPKVSCAPGQMEDTATGKCVAQCMVGMMSTPDREHCCWPGQTWNGEKNACAGAPTCPPGLVVVNETSCEPKPEAKPPGAEPTRSKVPLFVAGGGAVVLGVGVAIWLVGDSKYSDLEATCGRPSTCSRQQFDDKSGSIKTFDSLSVATMIVGGATLAGGLTWYFLSTPEAPQAAATPKVGLSFGPASARVVGTF